MTGQPVTVKLDLAELLSQASSRPPGGTAPGAAGLPARPLDSLKKESHGTVLLIEKDADVYRLISQLLEREGYTVLKASYVAEARSLLAKSKADFLVARRESLPVSAETELFLREVGSATPVRIVNHFSEFVLSPRAGTDTMTQSYVTMLDFLISQLEGTDPKVRGHSSAVAKYCCLVGKRMGMSPRDLDALNVAALVHDLDSLITKRCFSKVTQDQNGVQLPTYEKTVDQIAHVSVPFNVARTLLAASRPRHAPGGDGTEPPLAARILRIADVYDTLRRTNADVQEEDAFFYWMRGQPTGTFDAHALEVFVHLRKNERMLSTMDIFSAKVLIVDPKPEDVQQLQLRLENDDCRVITVGTVDAAMKVLASESITIVITECVFPEGQDGLRLLRSMKTDATQQRIPVFFHSASDTVRIKQALELGAEDWFHKPYNVDIIAMKIDRLIKRLRNEPDSSAEGIRGSVRDMGMIEMVQILGAANRSVRITIERDGANAEMIVHRGKIIAASLGELTGNQAAIEILLWEEGNFHVLPLKTAPAPNVTMNTDNLIMESCLQKDSRASSNSPTPR